MERLISIELKPKKPKNRNGSRRRPPYRPLAPQSPQLLEKLKKIAPERAQADVLGRRPATPKEIAKVINKK